MGRSSRKGACRRDGPSQGIALRLVFHHGCDTHAAASPSRPRPHHGRGLSTAAVPARLRATDEPPSRDLALPSLDLHQPPPIPFVRPGVRPGTRELGEPMRLPQPGPPLHARSRFGIILLRFGRRPSPLRQAEHIELRRHAVQHQAQPVSHAQVVSRLHTLTVDVNPATANGLRGKRARLEEARTPQPFIDAVAFGRGVVVFQSGKPGWRSASAYLRGQAVTPPTVAEARRVR